MDETVPELMSKGRFSETLQTIEDGLQVSMLAVPYSSLLAVVAYAHDVTFFDSACCLSRLMQLQLLASEGLDIPATLARVGFDAQQACQAARDSAGAAKWAAMVAENSSLCKKVL